MRLKRADDQVRRNHSVQYISFPEFPWRRLRKEFPEKYETDADLVPGEWAKIRIEVKGDKASLFVNGVEQPTFDRQRPETWAGAAGSIGPWIGPAQWLTLATPPSEKMRMPPQTRFRDLLGRNEGQNSADQETG